MYRITYEQKPYVVKFVNPQEIEQHVANAALASLLNIKVVDTKACPYDPSADFSNYGAVLLMSEASGECLKNVGRGYIQHRPKLDQKLVHDSLAWTILGNHDAGPRHAFRNENDDLTWIDTEYGIASYASPVGDILNEYFFSIDAREKHHHLFYATLNRLCVQAEALYEALPQALKNIKESDMALQKYAPEILMRAQNTRRILDELSGNGKARAKPLVRGL